MGEIGIQLVDLHTMVYPQLEFQELNRWEECHPQVDHQLEECYQPEEYLHRLREDHLLVRIKICSID
jgi:hypothetical protein